jgi:hypothetical protein
MLLRRRFNRLPSRERASSVANLKYAQSDDASGRNIDDDRGDRFGAENITFATSTITAAACRIVRAPLEPISRVAMSENLT